MPVAHVWPLRPPERPATPGCSLGLCRPADHLQTVGTLRSLGTDKTMDWVADSVTFKPTARRVLGTKQGP